MVKNRPQRHAPTIPADKETCDEEDRIVRSADPIAHETFDDGRFPLGKIVKWGLPALSALVPGGWLVKGITAGTTLAAGHLLDSFDKDQELEELRHQKAILEHQNEILSDRIKKEKDDDDSL